MCEALFYLKKKCKCKCYLFTHEAPKSLRAHFSVSVRSRSNWNLEVLVFGERGKPEYPEKNLSEQGREPTTNSTHISTPGFEPGPHWWEASALTTAPPLLPIVIKVIKIYLSLNVLAYLGCSAKTTTVIL